MKLATALKSLAIAAIAAMTFQNSSAQTPDRMFGIGVVTGGSFGAVQLAYALSPSFHIGAGLGIDLASQSVDGGSSTTSNNIIFAPFARLILKGTKNFKPFFHGQFIVASGKVTIGQTSQSQTRTALDFGGGAFYFPANDIGIFGQISVINLGFGDLSTSDLGFHSGRIGAEWYFN